MNNIIKSRLKFIKFIDNSCIKDFEHKESWKSLKEIVKQQLVILIKKL